MKQLSIARDTGSIPTFATEITDEGWTAQLAADTNTVLAVPAGSRFALISANDFFFVSESVITLPAGAFTKTDAEQSKQAVNVEGVASLNFRARNITDISVSFYR